MIMGKKTALAIAAAAAVIGAGIAAAGAVSGSRMLSKDNAIDVFDQQSFKTGAEGMVHVAPEDVFELENGIVMAGFYRGEDEYYEVVIGGIDQNRYSAGHFLVPHDEEGKLVYHVKVEECPEEIRHQVYNYYVDLFDSMYERALAREGLDREYMDMIEHLVSEEGHEELDSTLSHQMLKVTRTPNYGLMKAIGIAVAVAGTLAAVCILLSYRFKAKTIALGFAVLVLAALGVCIFAVRKQIATITSLKEIRPGVYTLKYTAGYKLDSILEADLRSEADLLNWLEDNIYFGLPVALKDNLFGCSAFLVTDENGNHLMGRNTDYPEADCLILYNDTDDGYDSISVVDLGIINIGSGGGQVKQNSFAGRVATLAMPYTLVEGMNEAGFGMSILALSTDELHQDTERKDVIYCVAARAVLDKCATVDEALELLRQYDIQMMLGGSCHFFLADKTGKSVIVEWFDNDMYVTENPACTNYIFGTDKYYIDPGSDDRYEVMMEELDGCNCVLSAGEAMALLQKVGYDNRGVNNLGTEWSCVYDLDNFTVTMCTDCNYDDPIVISKKTFGVK